ncbi:hypothetical protein A2Z33_02235 [Candidatus Gottesmanbacteria bacterium RBG_16_52_11]|uniref:Uncharacterized protein n=1 Tax=Candidatus Gottesmanbacteria bacterium RBG_16_52_11 TaxID=1798374 RepID=A0A1F5YR79_9BACT|nr:MAG: hypothetical protein A2Z33_02235 [Candidatus Gottesmanbacteria bacterium RBG_16_52_11]
MGDGGKEHCYGISHLLNLRSRNGNGHHPIANPNPLTHLKRPEPGQFTLNQQSLPDWIQLIELRLRPDELASILMTQESFERLNMFPICLQCPNQFHPGLTAKIGQEGKLLSLSHLALEDALEVTRHHLERVHRISGLDDLYLQPYGDVMITVPVNRDEVGIALYSTLVMGEDR